MSTEQQKNGLVSHARKIREQVSDLYDKADSIGGSDACHLLTKMLLDFNTLEIYIGRIPVAHLEPKEDLEKPISSSRSEQWGIQKKTNTWLSKPNDASDAKGNS